MVWARFVEYRKDTESLGLLVGLVQKFVENLNAFILREKENKGNMS
jgi:hypothetical protein